MEPFSSIPKQALRRPINYNVAMKPDSTITCPHCGQKTAETMPTTYCQHFWKCPHCGKMVEAPSGEDCVFCAYGDTKCPDKQQAAS